MKHTFRTSRSEHRRGFALLIVLMLAVVGAVLLTRYSLLSLRLVAQAERQENELQIRWGQWSAAQAMMIRADRILVGAGKQSSPTSENPPVATSAELMIRLGGMPLFVRICDLDAAVNVNTVVRHAGKSGLQRLFASAPIEKRTRELFAPRLVSDVVQSTKWTSDSWGELLNVKQCLRRPDGVRQLHDLQKQITCWGSGQLNIQRCSDNALMVLGKAISRSGLLERVIREREKGEATKLSDLIAAVGRGTEDTDLLESVLRETSTSWSVSVSSGEESPGMLLIRESGFGTFADRISVFSLE